MKKCEEIYPTKGKQISQIWRQKQLDYVWIKSLMDKYTDFWSITKDALIYTLEELELRYDEELLEKILNEYLYLSPYPEVIEALDIFRPRKLAILSNGNIWMLNELAKNTTLNKYLDDIISVDAFKVYKPEPDAYRLAAQRLGFNKEEIFFVSSNDWDVAGSKSYGFIAGWINRLNKPFDRFGIKPDYTDSDLKELAQKIKNK
jgi:2-haloalkanoic acid dehalogenase, type II